MKIISNGFNYLKCYDCPAQNQCEAARLTQSLQEDHIESELLRGKGELIDLTNEIYNLFGLNSPAIEKLSEYIKKFYSLQKRLDKRRGGINQLIDEGITVYQHYYDEPIYDEELEQVIYRVGEKAEIEPSTSPTSNQLGAAVFDVIGFAEMLECLQVRIKH